MCGSCKTCLTLFDVLDSRKLYTIMYIHKYNGNILPIRLFFLNLGDFYTYFDQHFLKYLLGYYVCLPLVSLDTCVCVSLYPWVYLCPQLPESFSVSLPETFFLCVSVTDSLSASPVSLSLSLTPNLTPSVSVSLPVCLSLSLSLNLPQCKYVKFEPSKPFT